MRVVTWNVNSIRARIDLVSSWVAEHEPDLLLMQETKVPDEQFPRSPLEQLGYHVATWGTGQWNGVAIASRTPLEEVRYGLDLAPEPSESEEPRLLAASTPLGWAVSVYVPNGRSLDDPHYAYKLAWLAGLRGAISALGAAVIGGDFNVAPADIDVWDPSALEGLTHVSPPEREAVAALRALGLVDVYRALHPDDPGFTWWDYRQGAFRRGMGMRIDLVLASTELADRVRAAWVDVAARRAARPSDHAPVVVEFDAAP